ncbi:MAG: YigZ family protein [Lachnospiraceae bacterium]|nr:YigZ family protein [Lachnospiraceae bacterium]
MSESITVLKKGGTGEIVEKKSRFIAAIEPVTSEEEAYAFIESVKKKHYDARHNCFAFSVGTGKNPLQRFSDDGEPQGTAGKPILEIINGGDIHNICIVVTRYFGGTLLGTGGLVRAYSDASKEGLKNCELKQLRMVYPTEVELDYTDVGKIQHLLAGLDIEIIDSVYAQKVTFKLHVPVEQKDMVEKQITEATAARAELLFDDEVLA